MNSNHHITRNALAMRVRLQHENERMREALHMIEDIAAASVDPKSLRVIGQIARTALAPSQPPNPALVTTS